MDVEVEFQGRGIFGLHISVGDLVNIASQSGDCDDHRLWMVK
jgi:hypothetical protein